MEMPPKYDDDFAISIAAATRINLNYGSSRPPMWGERVANCYWVRRFFLDERGSSTEDGAHY